MGKLRKLFGDASNRARATFTDGGWRPDGTGVESGGDTAAEAETEARAWAERALGDASTHHWDGQPDWGATR